MYEKSGIYGRLAAFGEDVDLAWFPSLREGTKLVVRMRGLEPPRLAAPEPKSGASTNFATSASPEMQGITAEGGIYIKAAHDVEQ